jgi:ornithine cyclodeaminase/alanine dehydrogenase-like protein (mu-crystallin family)
MCPFSGSCLKYGLSGCTKSLCACAVNAMPSHIGGEHAISGIKWIGSKHDNPSKRNMERASGVIAAITETAAVRILLIKLASITAIG